MVKWFYGVVSSKAAFVNYIESTYTYQKLICIHPLEMQEIAEEALFHAKRFKVVLPDYFDGMLKDPVAFSQEAIDQGIDPEFSEVTQLNNLNGTAFKNMVEYMEDLHKHIKPLKSESINDPLTVIASSESMCDDEIVDEEAYLNSVV